MKKFSFGFLLIFFYLSQPLLAQSYVNLFSDFIPVEYLKNEDKVEQMEVNFDYYAMISPDLIYYYINYLNISVNNKVFNRDSNYSRILNYNASISSKLNNEWVEQEVNKAERLLEPELAINELKSLLNDFEVQKLNTQKNTVELYVDENLQRFFSVKSLRVGQNLTYDEKVDYQKMLKDKIQELISQMRTDYENVDLGNASTRKIKFDYLLQHHIFSPGFCGGNFKSDDFDFLQYILSFIDHTKFEENSGIILGFSTETILQTFPGETFNEPYLPYANITIPSTTSEITFYNLALGYRLKFKEFKSAFSHLDLNVAYSLTSSSFSDISNLTVIDKFYFIWEGEPGNFSLLFFGTIESVSWELSNFSEFSFYVNTPVFYLSHNLFFDVGLQYKYFTTEYNVTVHRDIEDQIAEDPSMLGPEDEKYTFNSESNLFGGFIGVNYSPFRNFSLICTLSTFKSIQLGFNYLFKL